MRCRTLLLPFIVLALGFWTSVCLAAPPSGWSPAPGISIQIGTEAGQGEPLSTALQLVIFLTLLSVAPSLIIAVTCFTRIIIVLAFLRQAIGLPQVPPNQVLLGLSLFLTLFIMSPVIDSIYANAYQPYVAQTVTGTQALENAAEPLRRFMLHSTREKDLALFLSISNLPQPATPAEIPLRSLIPAFLISELRTAFQIGFMIYIPFLIIDIVVSSVLLAMGMMVLPPMLISIPIKLMLFVLVDGWNLLVDSLVKSFRS